MRVGIVAQRHNDRAHDVARDVFEAVRDVSVVVDTETAVTLDVEGTPVTAFADCDLVVSIGGDGTFLFVARNVGDTPILGVNLGEVGFLNAVAPEDAVAAVERAVERFRESGAVRSQPLPRLRASGDGWELPPALNEVTVQGAQRGHGSGIELVARVDGETYLETHADGVLVATPTGSTAYNLSEDGPLVRPDTGVTVLNPMCASAAMPPLVYDDGADLDVELTGADHAYVVGDGSTPLRLDPPLTVTVTRAAEPARVAGPGVEFFEALGKLQ